MMVLQSSFLQSAAWENFQRALGRKTWRVADTLVIRHDLPFGLHYLYAPHPDIRGGFFPDIQDIAMREKSIFLKIDPLISLQSTTRNLQPSISIQPQETLIIDLTQSEEDILAAMHGKTRYNIRLAERKGVEIKNYRFPSADIHRDMFRRLLGETAARDGFRAHPKEYYKKLLEIRSDSFSNELFFAEYRGETLAAAMVNFHRSETSIGGAATYLHGASGTMYREVMAPHLLHWRIMQEAKKRGCVAYDLWGVDEKRWPGITRFKKGFGGSVLVHPPSVDIIYRPGWYSIYSLWKRFSRK